MPMRGTVHDHDCNRILQKEVHKRPRTDIFHKKRSVQCYEAFLTGEQAVHSTKVIAPYSTNDGEDLQTLQECRLHCGGSAAWLRVLPQALLQGTGVFRVAHGPLTYFPFICARGIYMVVEVNVRVFSRVSTDVGHFSSSKRIRAPLLNCRAEIC